MSIRAKYKMYKTKKGVQDIVSCMFLQTKYEEKQQKDGNYGCSMCDGRCDGNGRNHGVSD